MSPSIDAARAKAPFRWLFAGAHPPWYPLSFSKAAKTDIVAGLALWGFLVPEAIANAGIAGVPPQAGLYTLMVSLVVYGIFGSSRRMVVASTSAAAATTSAVLADIGGDRVQSLALLGIAVGAFYLLAAAMKLAFMVRFISRPVHAGFLVGLAIFIVVGQLPHLFGLHKDGDRVDTILISMAAHVGDINVVTTGIGFASLAALSLLGRYVPKIPSGLLVTALAIVLSTVLSLSSRYGVEVVGKIPLGLPAPVLPSIPWHSALTLIGGALGLLLVTFTETTSIAAEGQRGAEKVDNNVELRSMGLANMASGVSGGLIVGGALSSTGLNEQSGARTQLSTAVAGVGAVATGLWLAPVLENLPKTILAALIIHAVSRHINVKSLQLINRYSRAEFILAIIALFGVLLFGVVPGLLIAVLCNTLYFVYRSLKLDIIGPESGSSPDELLLRVEGEIFYGNADEVRDRVQQLVVERHGVTTVVLALPAQYGLDVTTVETLHDLSSDLRKVGVTLTFADVPPRLQDRTDALLGVHDDVAAARALATER